MKGSRRHLDVFEATSPAPEGIPANKTHRAKIRLAVANLPGGFGPEVNRRSSQVVGGKCGSFLPERLQA